MTPHTRETFRGRAVAVSSMRRWLDEREFLEIETPVLQSMTGNVPFPVQDWLTIMCY